MGLPFLLALVSLTSFSADPSKIGEIEVIAGKNTIEVQRAGIPTEVKRGSAILVGDTITTGTETVYLKMKHSNEIQITPKTTVTFDESGDLEGQRSVITLQQGIAWMLIANGHSVDSPLYVKTPTAAIGIIAANVVIEHTADGKTTALVNEGSAKYARNMVDVMGQKKSRFISSGLRIHITPDQMNEPKRFKRSLLIAYLNKHAKVTAQDMVTRGARVLSVIAKKEQKKLGENEITWNVPVGAPSSSTNGMMPVDSQSGQNHAVAQDPGMQSPQFKAPPLIQ